MKVYFERRKTAKVFMTYGQDLFRKSLSLKNLPKGSFGDLAQSTVTTERKPIKQNLKPVIPITRTSNSHLPKSQQVQSCMRKIGKCLTHKTYQVIFGKLAHGVSACLLLENYLKQQEFFKMTQWKEWTNEIRRTIKQLAISLHSFTISSDVAELHFILHLTLCYVESLVAVFLVPYYFPCSLQIMPDPQRSFNS